ncbi:hypothetical protein MKX08_003332 [Trichoderma sp. CBMAI-0020]|nr:hypothetical protein MKX08_003332 [Trichoderma sp. CBMAI-0020]
MTPEDLHDLAASAPTRGRALLRHLMLLKPVLTELPKFATNAFNNTDRYNRRFWTDLLTPCTAIELACWRFDLLHDAHTDLVRDVLDDLDKMVQVAEANIPEELKATQFPRIETIARAISGANETDTFLIELVKPDNADGFLDLLNGLADIMTYTEDKSQSLPEISQTSPKDKPLMAPLIQNLFSTLSLSWHCTNACNSSHETALALFTNRAYSLDNGSSFTVLLSKPNTRKSVMQWLEADITCLQEPLNQPGRGLPNNQEKRDMAKTWFDSINWDVCEQWCRAAESCINGTIIESLNMSSTLAVQGNSQPVPGESLIEIFARAFYETILAPLEAEFALQWPNGDPDQVISTLKLPYITNPPASSSSSTARSLIAITYFSQKNNPRGEDNVDILTLSFGFPRYDDVLKPINDAIRKARDNGVIIFAAAGNEGGNAGVSWPASLHETGDVIRINSSDGKGSTSGLNPSPEIGRWICTLGQGVPSCQVAVDTDEVIHRSGSSFATPIAAAIAAIILGVVDNAVEVERMAVEAEDMTVISKYPKDLAAFHPRLRTRLGMEKHASLDYQLRTAPSVKATVEGNLEGVCEHLLTILKGSSELSKGELNILFDIPQSEVSAFAKSLLPKLPHCMPKNHTRKSFKLVETRITLLHQLSLAIRRVSNRDNLTEVPKLFNSDAEYVIRRGQKKDGSDSETVIKSVHFDIGTGLEEFTRKVLTHRWLQYCSSNCEDLDKERHIYRQTILERCVSAISTRKRQLEYFRAHRNCLEKNSRKEALLWPSGQKATPQYLSQPTVHPRNETVASRSANAKFKRLLKSLATSMGASSKHEPPLKFFSTSLYVSTKSLETSSCVSKTTTTVFGGDGPFDVPQPPRLDKYEKEKACPYCCLLLPAATFSTHDEAGRWERHLLEDLQPYVCLFTDCTTPGKTYSSFEAWKSHLSQPHYQSWQCSWHPKDDNSNAANKESFTFKTLDEFKHHIKIYHPDCDPMSANDPFQHARRLAVLPQWCFVCFKVLPEPVDLLQHMARHFESMSLLALPWREDIVDNEAIASDEGAADEHDVARDTELGRVGFGGEEATGDKADEPIRAYGPQGLLFDALLSIINRRPASPRHRLDPSETWVMGLGPPSEMLGPDKGPTRPPSPQINSSVGRLSPRDSLNYDFGSLEDLGASLYWDKPDLSPANKTNSYVYNRRPSKFSIRNMASVSKRGVLIKTALASLQTTSNQYKDDLQSLDDLPTEFAEVNQCFPLVEDILRHARNSVGDVSSMKVIQPLAASLEKKVKMLQTVSSKVGKELDDSNEKSVLDCYHDTVIDMGKPYCVEALMLGVLKDLNALYTNELLKPKDHDKIGQLEGAINRLSNVESSVPDADFETTGARFTQNVHNGGVGNQAYYGGRGHHVVAGSGAINNYNAQTISFVSPFQEGYGDQVSHRMGDDGQNSHREPRTGNPAISHNQLQLRPSQAQAEGRPSGREDFQIAIICALPLEYDVVSLLFDRFWDDDESYGRARGDTNTYTNGRMGPYNVVLALLPNVGTVAAAGVAASFRSSYPNLQLAFLVGICSGVPITGENEIHLGDVVISNSAVQYDLGKQYNRKFVVKDTVDDVLGRPNKNIRSLVASFKTEHIRGQLQQKACLHLQYLQSAAAKRRRRQNYKYPGIHNDMLFVADYRHKHRGAQTCSVCNSQTDGFCEQASKASCAELGCDETNLVKRTDLEMRGSAEDIEIFIGRIASGNSVIKSGEYRDKIAQEQGVIALEMEGAGLWDEIPCIIVKGVSDYADGHKNDLWQRYAAATAASVLKAVLGRYTMTDR